MKWSRVLVWSPLAVAFCAAADPLPVSDPTPGKQAAADFKTKEGFSLTLLAEEPLLTDPVAMCYDADGRAYVAEMNDYPYTDKARHLPMQENPTDEAIGKIRLLTDDDGDGRFDRSTIFADNLSWPTGVTPWKGGVFVTAVPDFWYFKDTDGDGIADVKKKVVTGFRKYNVQSGANTPIWGLDNRIYIATGRNRGTLGDGTEIPPGRDVRIDPHDPESFEFVSGGIQFGNTIDDWGNRFLCSAGGSVHHVVLPAEAVERNPWLPSRATVRGCLDPEDPVKLFPITGIEGWRLQRYKDREFVPRPGYQESRGAVGEPARPTSSCGPAVYRGDAYPESFRGSMFVAESCYNLVYRLNLEKMEPTFRAVKPKADRESDFIASEDVWFRPMAMINAPDGCLHLLDFYRESIEHPWSLPESFHERMDLLLGRDRGRIYRVEPPGYDHRSPVKLSNMESAKLVPLLAHPNAWHRQTAQRLLFERQDSSVVEALEELALHSDQSLGRLHAIWTLHGLDALEPELLAKLSGDPEEGVRINLANIAATMRGSHPEILPTLLEMSSDSSAAVRYQVALAMGGSDSDDVADALVSIALLGQRDSWSRLAVMSSARPHAARMLSVLLENSEFQDLTLLRSLAKFVGAEHRDREPSILFARIAESSGDIDERELSVVFGLAEGLRISKSSVREVASGMKGGTRFLDSLIRRMKAVALDSDASVSRRVEGVQFLRNASFESVRDDLEPLLNSDVPGEIQSAAAAVISISGGKNPEVGEILLAGWPGYNGTVRNEILQLLLARDERLPALLEAVEDGRIPAYQLGPSRREALIAHEEPGIAEKARALFADAGSRIEILEEYRPSLDMKGDPSNGETVYQGLCMACHKFREQGAIELAPNLAVVSTWESERILTNILDPNRDVAPEYMEYLVETKGGETIAGRMVSESAAGITIRLADNSTRDVARADIVALNNSGRSLMPDGLEAAITKQGMADLISFLQSKE